MEGNILEMLQGMLSDPAAMEKLMGVAQNLMGSQGTATPSAPPSQGTAASSDNPPPHDASVDAPSPSHSLLPTALQTGNGERIALIKALRPYLSPERRRTADSLIQMLSMLKLADLNKLFKE